MPVPAGRSSKTELCIYQRFGVSLLQCHPHCEAAPRSLCFLDEELDEELEGSGVE